MASIIVGKELADLVSVSPGPVVTCNAIFDKMLSYNTKEKKDISLKKVVNETSLDWKRDIAKGLAENSALSLTPILYSIVESVKYDGDPKWSVAAEKQLRLDLNTPLVLQQISYQIFIEIIFLKFLSRLEVV